MERFFASLIDPRGGGVYKSGVGSLTAYLRHEASPASLTLYAEILDGVPFVRVELTGPPAEHGPAPVRILYSGSLAEDAPAVPAMPAPFDLTASLCSCGAPMRRFEAEDGLCNACAAKTAAAAS